MCPESVRSSNIQTPGREVVAEARKFLGTPFRHQGRTMGVGIDCAGLIVGVGGNLGRLNFDTRAYSHMPDGVTMKRLCDTYLDRVDELGLGHVLLMKFKKFAQHLAIVGDGSPFSIIHAYAEPRKCVEHRLDRVWMSRICGIYRFKGTG